MKILRWATGNWFSRIYLLMIAAVTADAVVAILTADEPDYSKHDLVPIVLTMPGSMLVAVLAQIADLNRWVILGSSVAVGALLNAAAINGLVSLAKRWRAAVSPAARPEPGPPSQPRG